MEQREVIPPKYSADKFVDREDEVKLVLERARALADGYNVSQRVIIFTGARGTGKTWLLAHLETELGEVEGLYVYALRLEEYAGRDPNVATMDILKQLMEEVRTGHGDLGTTLAGLNRGLIEALQSMLKTNAMALLVDQVHESDRKLLKPLEDYLLGPLALEPRVLVVMTGRGRTYVWKTELRLKAKSIDLQPFPNVELTAEQLRRQQKRAVPRASEIHELSNGNPLANFLLGAYDSPTQVLDQVVEGMLDTVPDGRRRYVRDCCEALCVLRSFDEDRIPVMLAAYHENRSYAQCSYADASEVREELMKWGLAKYHSGPESYVLDEPTRWLVEQSLKASNREKWRALHETACHLYREWVREYPRAQSHWQPEVDYHKGFLDAGTS